MSGRGLAFELLLVTLGAVALLGALLAVRWLLRLLPMRRERRDALHRAAPVAGTLVTLAYALVATTWLFSDYPRYVPVGLALVVAAFVGASWQTLRDVVSGVVLRAGSSLGPGDQVRIETVRGRVAKLGWRTVVIETREGEEALLPYSRVARSRLLRTSSRAGVTMHVFHLRTPEQLSIAEVRAAVRETALGVHWSAISRVPEVAAVTDGAFEVTVYALEPDRASDIEAAVRADPRLQSEPST